MTAAPIKAARLEWLAINILTLLGLAVATYLTFEHIVGNTSLACSAGGTIDCFKVTTSEWSTIGTVPVAFLGLGFFAAMTVLCAPLVRDRQLRAVTKARVALATIGAATVVYLVWAEWQIGAICLWCTAVHVIEVALLVLVVRRARAEHSSEFTVDEYRQHAREQQDA